MTVKRWYREDSPEEGRATMARAHRTRRGQAPGATQARRARYKPSINRLVAPGNRKKGVATLARPALTKQEFCIIQLGIRQLARLVAGVAYHRARRRPGLNKTHVLYGCRLRGAPRGAWRLPPARRLKSFVQSFPPSRGGNSFLVFFHCIAKPKKNQCFLQKTARNVQKSPKNSCFRAFYVYS